MSTSKDKLLPGLSNWQTQYQSWVTLKKRCIAAKGPNGVYCELRGTNCSFLGCVLRLFDSPIVSELEEKVARLEEKYEALQELVKTELKIEEVKEEAPQSQPQSSS